MFMSELIRCLGLDPELAHLEAGLGRVELAQVFVEGVARLDEDVDAVLVAVQVDLRDNDPLPVLGHLQDLSELAVEGVDLGELLLELLDAFLLGLAFAHLVGG